MHVHMCIRTSILCHMCMYVEVRGQRVREENLSQDKLIMVVILRCVTLPPPQSVDPVLLSDWKTRRSTGQGRKGWAEAPSKSLPLNTHLTFPHPRHPWLIIMVLRLHGMYMDDHPYTKSRGRLSPLPGIRQTRKGFGHDTCPDQVPVHKHRCSG